MIIVFCSPGGVSRPEIFGPEAAPRRALQGRERREAFAVLALPPGSTDSGHLLLQGEAGPEVVVLNRDPVAADRSTPIRVGCKRKHHHLNLGLFYFGGCLRGSLLRSRPASNVMQVCGVRAV